MEFLFRNFRYSLFSHRCELWNGIVTSKQGRSQGGQRGPCPSAKSECPAGFDDGPTLGYINVFSDNYLG